MPVISPRGADGRSQQTAQTSEAWQQPRKTITATTQASTFHNPYSAPDVEPKTSQTAETDQEIKQSGSLEGQEEKTVSLSPQLTALARREHKFRQQEQAFKAEQKRLESEKAELSELKALKAKLEAKDYSALESNGMNYEDYTQYKLNQAESQKPEVQELNKLKEEINSLKTSQEEQISKQYDATISQYRNDIKKLVASSPDFETIRESGAEAHVLQHIIDTFEQDDETLTVEEACKEVEEAILEDAMKAAKYKKVQAKLAPEKKTLPPPQKGLRTLTQQIVQPGKTQGRQSQFLSPKERLALALQKAQRPQE